MSPRLFAMPVADVVGAYRASVSYDGSLLRQPGVLSSAGVVAIGVGDLAQLEYRHTSAIGAGRIVAPVPAVGVQVKLPLPERRYLPALGVAFRLGLPRRERVDGVAIDETVTDLYAVAGIALGGRRARVTAHAGLRVSTAVAAIDGAGDARRLLWLPAVGIAVAANDRTDWIAEFGAVPSFRVDNGAAAVGVGATARAGIRWRIVPAATIDASLGYRIESAAVDGPAARGARAVVDWDIRVGGELHVPWGALVCRAAGLFCSRRRDE